MSERTDVAQQMAAEAARRAAEAERQQQAAPKLGEVAMAQVW